MPCEGTRTSPQAEPPQIRRAGSIAELKELLARLHGPASGGTDSASATWFSVNGLSRVNLQSIPTQHHAQLSAHQHPDQNRGSIRCRNKTAQICGESGVRGSLRGSLWEEMISWTVFGNGVGRQRNHEAIGGAPLRSGARLRFVGVCSALLPSFRGSTRTHGRQRTCLPPSPSSIPVPCFRLDKKFVKSWARSARSCSKLGGAEKEPATKQHCLCVAPMADSQHHHRH